MILCLIFFFFYQKLSVWLQPNVYFQLWRIGAEAQKERDVKRNTVEEQESWRRSHDSRKSIKKRSIEPAAQPQRTWVTPKTAVWSRFWFPLMVVLQCVFVLKATHSWLRWPTYISPPCFGALSQICALRVVVSWSQRRCLTFRPSPVTLKNRFLVLLQKSWGASAEQRSQTAQVCSHFLVAFVVFS